MENDAVPVPDILWLSCDGMMVIDQHRRVLAMNPAMEQLTGRKSAEVLGKTDCASLLACRDFHGCRLAERSCECPGLKAMQRFEAAHSAEYLVRNSQGKTTVVSSSYTPIQLPGKPVWALVVMRDVTRQKLRERRLARQAMTDPLTGLPNRTALMETCSKELKRASRHFRPLGVAMLDLDGFKKYNDTCGHQAGDGLLKILAGLFQAGRRASDLVARYGGDEFSLLLPETDAAGAMVVAQRLHYLITRFPLVVFPSSSNISLSIGIAVYPEDGITPEALLAQADRRLYEAKRQGGNRVVGPPSP